MAHVKFIKQLLLIYIICITFQTICPLDGFYNYIRFYNNTI